jgi:hypothetical protein
MSHGSGSRKTSVSPASGSELEVCPRKSDAASPLVYKVAIFSVDVGGQPGHVTVLENPLSMFTTIPTVSIHPRTRRPRGEQEDAKGK